MFYHFDIDRFISQLLPPVLRKTFIYTFLKVLLYPVKQLHAVFLAYKLSVDRELTYNSFQNYLERFLNGLFFFEYQAIYITDVERPNADLSYQDEAVGQADYMSYQEETPSTAIELSSLASADITGSFIIHVPAALSQADIASVRNWANYYKMAGTEFTIEEYE